MGETIRNKADLPTRKDLLDDYLVRPKVNLQSLVATALRTRSVTMRDLLVRRAFTSRISAEELKLDVLAGKAYENEVTDPLALSELGRLVMLQNILQDDLVFGEAILGKGLTLSSEHKVPGYLKRTYVQRLINTGQLDEARALLDQWPDVDAAEYGYLRAEFFNPFTHGDKFSLESWLLSFNRSFTDNDLAPVTLYSTGEHRTPFDRLRALSCDRKEAESSSASEQEDTLVSVVLTAFRPDHTRLETSVVSILEQTWKNLELIIVDDCSGSDYAQVFRYMESLDARVRIIHAKSNQGTYVARNIGYAASKGEFITGQDDDDWSHPERISHQVDYMRRNPEAIGCRVLGIRCDEQLGRVRLGYSSITENASSLLVKREGFTATGGFLAARKAADNEFFFRVAKATGCRVGLLKEPLSIIRILPKSLSRSDFSPGWKHTARRSFRSSYEYWHKNASANALNLNNVSEPEVKIPRRFEISGAKEAVVFDVVFAGDWQNFGGPQKSMLEEIHALKQQGLRVGVMNLEAARFMTKDNQKPLVPALQELINVGYVDEIHYDEAVHVDLLILRYPPILQFFTHDTTNLEVDRLVILANQAPSELDGSDIRYFVRDCDDTATRAFGVKPLWVPQGPSVRDFLESYRETIYLATFDLPGILKIEDWWHDRIWYRSDIPVVGRHSRDNIMKWPERREVMEAVYPTDGQFDVRIMGGATSALKVLDRTQTPPGWTVYKNNELDVPHFLSSLDYFVFFQHSNAVEAFGRAVLEAIASGTVVLLPPHYERVFGEGAIYCEYDEVHRVIENLHSNFDKYQSQVRRAKSVVTDKFSYASYQMRIKTLMAVKNQE